MQVSSANLPANLHNELFDLASHLQEVEGLDEYYAYKLFECFFTKFETSIPFTKITVLEIAEESEACCTYMQVVFNHNGLLSAEITDVEFV